MALALDILQRIINVHWGGGGVFVAGDIDGNIYYLKLEAEKEPVWKALGKLDFHKEEEESGFFTGRVAGSAYAMVDVKDSAGDVIGTTPVFVLVGGSGFTNEVGIIMASRDGSNWSRVFSFGGEDEDDTFLGAGIFGVVWDATARMFYAGGHQVDTFVDVEAGMKWEKQTDILFESSDGFTWQESDRHEIRVDSALAEVTVYPEYNTGLLVAHCRTLVKDENGNGIPDGNYGYDQSKILVAPASVIKIDYLYGLYLNDVPSGSSVSVTSHGEDAPPAYPPDVGIPITCTATVGGKWLAAGGVHANFDSGEGRSQSVILVESEDGNRWDALELPGGTNAIITMTAGIIGKDAGL